MPAKSTSHIRISAKERLLFIKHLSAMTKAGIPIADSLYALHLQHKKGRLAEILSSLTKTVTAGQSLSVALEKHPKAFSSLFVGIISISEKSGTLSENLAYLLEQQKKEYRLRKKIQSAVVYPAFILVTALGIALFLTLFVLPTLTTFFESLQVELPLVTKIMLQTSLVIRKYGLLLLLGCLIIGSGVAYSSRFPKIRILLEKLVFKIPILGTILKTNQIIQFTRNWGLLVKSGIPIDQAISITQKSLSSHVYQIFMKDIAAAVDGGTSIHSICQNLPTEFIPTMVHQMIGVGEKTGSLDEVLLYVAEFYEEELDALTKQLTTLLEPILLLGIGLGVGFLALAIITPIYELTSAM